jgi:hypothetical protein
MRNFFKKHTVVELAVYSALAFIFLSCNPSWANQIKKSTAATFYFLARNASNLSQYITGLTTETTNITVYRNNMSALSVTTNTMVEIANGLYKWYANATHTNTTGQLVWRVNWSSGDFWGLDEVVDNLASDVYAKADAANTSASAANATVNHATYGNSPIYNLVGTRGTSNLTPSDNIGINWGDITNPTTTVGLTGTTISTSQAVASVSGAVGSVTGNVGGNLVGNVGGNVNGSTASVVGNIGGNVGGNVNGSVASVVSAVDINSNQDLTDALSNIASVKGTVEALPSAADVREEMDTNSTKLADTLSNVTSTKSTAEAINTTVNDIPNTSEFEARTLPSDDYFNSSADPVWLNQTTAE